MNRIKMVGVVKTIEHLHQQFAESLKKKIEYQNILAAQDKEDESSATNKELQAVIVQLRDIALEIKDQKHLLDLVKN